MKLLNNIWNYKPVKGYKHWIAMALLVVVGGLKYWGYINDQDFALAMSLLGALGLKAAADHVVKK